nr:glycine-rich cell wall structural protein 1.0-like [Penaeus vannamei]
MGLSLSGWDLEDGAQWMGLGGGWGAEWMGLSGVDGAQLDGASGWVGGGAPNGAVEGLSGGLVDGAQWMGLMWMGLGGWAQWMAGGWRGWAVMGWRAVDGAPWGGDGAWRGYWAVGAQWMGLSGWGWWLGLGWGCGWGSVDGAPWMGVDGAGGWGWVDGLYWGSGWGSVEGLSGLRDGTQAKEASVRESLVTSAPLRLVPPGDGLAGERY